MVHLQNQLVVHASDAKLNTSSHLLCSCFPSESTPKICANFIKGTRWLLRVPITVFQSFAFHLRGFFFRSGWKRKQTSSLESQAVLDPVQHIESHCYRRYRPLLGHSVSRLQTWVLWCKLKLHFVFAWNNFLKYFGILHQEMVRVRVCFSYWLIVD